ncbi:hypothetical protein AB0N17_08815 [Streptomyces sp. NPDC051133]|uniref:hypothetical protein n=1 Tax=Streptomyces sp. NPDC051133 TaxID=3155521 RepID=UPI00341A91F2
MDSTGDPMDAQQARHALAAARAAQCAARKAGDERNRPRVYAIGQGLAFAAGFTALGVADREPRWGVWLVLAGLLSLTVFLVLIWLGAHHGGVTRWFSRDGRTGRPAWYAWVVPFLPAAVGLLAAIPYGTTGWLVAFGVASGAEYLLRATRQGGAA